MELYAQSGLRLTLPRREQRNIHSFFKPANRFARPVPDAEQEIEQFQQEELSVEPVEFVAKAQEAALSEQQETRYLIDESRIPGKPVEVDQNQNKLPGKGKEEESSKESSEVVVANQVEDYDDYELEIIAEVYEQHTDEEREIVPDDGNRPYADQVTKIVLNRFRGLNKSGGTNNSIGLAGLERIIDAMHAIVPFTKDSIFIDFGCGAGVPGYYVHARFGCKCVGLDYDPELIRIAKYFQERFSTKADNGTYDCKFFEFDFKNVTVTMLQQSQMTHCFCFDEVFDAETWNHLFWELLGKCGLQGFVGCSTSKKQYAYLPPILVPIGGTIKGAMMNAKSPMTFRCWQYQEEQQSESEEIEIVAAEQPAAEEPVSDSDSEVVEIVPPTFVQVSKVTNLAVQQMHNESPLYFDAIQRPDLLAERIAYFNKTRSDFVIRDTPPYGKGLFALKPIEKDRIIGFYYGVVIPNELAARLPSTYVKIAEITPAHKKGTMSICADMVHLKDHNQFNYVAFANDPGFVVEKGELIGPAQRENAKLKTAPLGTNVRVHMVAKRDIREGEEILTFYGEPYWDPAQNPDGKQYYAVRDKFYADKAKKKGKK